MDLASFSFPPPLLNLELSKGAAGEGEVAMLSPGASGVGCPGTAPARPRHTRRGAAGALQTPSALQQGWWRALSIP